MNNAQKKIALSKQVQAATAASDRAQTKAALQAKVEAALSKSATVTAAVEPDKCESCQNIKADAFISQPVAPEWQRQYRKVLLADKVEKMTGKALTASARKKDLISITSFELISAQMERNRKGE